MYVQYTNPAGYPPLQHSSRILANNGWKVLFLGSGAQGADALEFPQHPNIRVKRVPFCPAGWRQKLHYAQFTFWVLSWALLWRPRWIYASDLLACPVALLLSFVPGLKVLYHEHDSPTTKLKYSISKFERVVLKMRCKAAQRANLCVLPNESRAERFMHETGIHRPVLQVWNCAALEEVNARCPQPETNNFVIYFHGSIGPGHLPMTILDALKKLPDSVVLRVAGYETIGHVGYIQALKNRAAMLGIGHRVTFLGSFARSTLLDHCRNASVGLAFMPLQSDNVNERAMTGASNKSFDYLACGLALLVSELPDWKEMFVEPGYALACDPEDPESIARQLRWFMEHAAETRSMGARGRQRIIAEWNYERQFSPVLDLMERQLEHE